jgi:phage terminase large subunit-like protein
LEVVYFDEEPDEGIYSEGLTRTNETGGIVFVCFTPLLGMSTVVQRFLSSSSTAHPDRAMVTATIDDAPHFSAAAKAQIAASYQPHELEARTKGVPVLGSGRIFPVKEETLAIEHREFPRHWARIGGMDFGWDHPFAAVELVWDRDTDTIYVSRTYCMREATAVIHAAALKPWGNLPWAWPRDGRRETLEGAGVCAGQAVYGARARHAAHARAIRRQVDQRRGRHCRHADPDGEWALQGFQVPDRLV